MERVELLTVIDRFQIEGRGVIVSPDFSVPNGRWKYMTDTVVVMRPNGSALEIDANFSLSHFEISDPTVSLDKRWRVVVSLPSIKKDELPVGSKILVSQRVRDALFNRS